MSYTIINPATGEAMETIEHATVEQTDDAIARARRQLRQGPGLEHCEECDAPIPLARRQAVPRVAVHAFNRRLIHQYVPKQDASVAVHLAGTIDALRQRAGERYQGIGRRNFFTFKRFQRPHNI